MTLADPTLERTPCVRLTARLLLPLRLNEIRQHFYLPGIPEPWMRSGHSDAIRHLSGKLKGQFQERFTPRIHVTLTKQGLRSKLRRL